jgi:multicomponent Na+:H+ antiporter subunit B
MTEPDLRHKRAPDETVVGGWHRVRLGAALAAAAAGAMLVGVVGLPREAAHLPAIAVHALQIALPKWGTTEVVSEVVYGSRGFDTFGETMLLIAAIVSVVTLTRSREGRHEYVGESQAAEREQQSADPQSGRQNPRTEEAEQAEEHGTEDLPEPDEIPLGEPGPESSEGMIVFVRVAARVAAVILAVAGVYLAAWGYTPGGGFPAGVVLTGIAIFVYAAFGRSAVRGIVRPTVLEPIEMVTGLVLAAVGLVGLAREGSVFANWVPLAQPQTILAGGNQQIFSGLELVEVAASLTIAVFALLGMGHDWTPQDEGGDESEE